MCVKGNLFFRQKSPTNIGRAKSPKSKKKAKTKTKARAQPAPTSALVYLAKDRHHELVRFFGRDLVVVGTKEDGVRVRTDHPRHLEADQREGEAASRHDFARQHAARVANEEKIAHQSPSLR